MSTEICAENVGIPRTKRPRSRILTNSFDRDLVVVWLECRLLEWLPIHGAVAETVHLKFSISVGRSLPGEFNTELVVVCYLHRGFELGFRGNTAMCCRLLGPASHAVAFPGNGSHLQTRSIRRSGYSAISLTPGRFLAGCHESAVEKLRFPGRDSSPECCIRCPAEGR